MMGKQPKDTSSLLLSLDIMVAKGQVSLLALLLLLLPLATTAAHIGVYDDQDEPDLGNIEEPDNELVSEGENPDEDINVVERDSADDDAEAGEAPDQQLLDLGLFEGDIENVNASDVEGRNAISNPRLKWPNGLVPYVISSSFSAGSQKTILRGMDQYHRSTCIKFKPHQNERDFIFIQPGTGCSSSVGRQGGRQTVNLGSGCVYQGIVVHELMHVVGFWHEQSRPDRDQYVTVNWDNIQNGMKHNFMKFSHGEVDTLKLPYDIGSVMHYGPYYFARNSRVPTLQSRSGARVSMGQRDGFSRLDIQKVNKLYRCSNRRRHLH